MQQVKGRLVDLDRREIYGAVITIDAAGTIAAIDRDPERDKRGWYILPGFVDAHVHIESSMLLPVEFAKLAVVHGTVATVSDPHEIANVLGMEGVEYMLENAAHSPLHIHFGAPSCVPATTWETAGATLGVEEVTRLLERPDIHYLSEVMNYPGVLHGDPELLAKIAAAVSRRKPVDGHAPGLRGPEAAAYAAAGITTDHECVSAAEARDKLAAGMKILIREGSAARNYAALHELIDEFPDQLMFCTDDSHPDDLMAGHINRIVQRALRDGHDLFNVLRIACRNPIEHYGLHVGQLRVGDPADFIQIDDLQHQAVMTTYLRGKLVAEAGHHNLPDYRSAPVNRFHCSPKTPADFAVAPAPPGARLRVIEVFDGELLTGRQLLAPVCDAEGCPVAAPERDLLKIAVINRYADAPPAIGFVTGMKLQRGAIASSVAHDSHNIVVVGTDDAAMCRVANAVIASQGGIAAGRDEHLLVLPLPVAGIMSDDTGPRVAARYGELTGFARRKLRCGLQSPFMTLSFLALLVIPALKMSDRGLFDAGSFSLTDLWELP
ncbi:adenine deaminase [Neolewinella lacunae]|uniref:Adenine deaminase n=1 Tax=Neolewinella lacunae TaxID=1517758 RepID=A0A923PPM8_9BACT|nr:adenine deaminase [Neolewinella lacunae]MBC6994402.1 adenine deaminase [Neolewinella lacunae]MDN3633333.1 adenine deaminase [Neolewinella lacunae]